MLDLILDVKFYIAKLDEEVWYHLYLYDEEFKKYSKSEVGIKLFKQTFTKCLTYVKYIEYHLLGKLHRDNDLPAVITLDGYQAWYQNGKLHRDHDLPAVIHPRGSQEWYQHGQCHRNYDLPAKIWVDGSHSWFINGEFINTVFIN